MRAVVYTRISLDRFGDSSGVTRQHEDALQLIKQRGWDLVAEYQDNDISAAGKKQRPGFDSMMQRIESGEVDAVVAWSFDRLSRNRRDELRLIEACQEHSVTLALVRGSDVDMSTPAGRMVADIMATTARHEIEVKSDRQKRANRQRALQGKPHLTHRPFGYEDDGVTIRPTEAEALKWAYSQILAGSSLRAVSKRFNEDGLLTSYGQGWNGDKVRQSLRRPRYMGYRYHNGERAGKAIWEPIVSQEIFEAVQAILDDPSRTISKDRKVKYLLVNIADCGKCGAKVKTYMTPKSQRSYACSKTRHFTRKAQPIDDLVEAVVIKRLSRPDVRELLRPAGLDDVDVTRLRNEANAQRVRIDEAAQLFAEGKIRATQLEKITAACEAEITRLEEQIAASVSTTPLVSLVGVADVQEAWNALDISVKREVLRTVFDRIILEPVARGQRTFDPESVTFAWKG